MIQLRLPKGRPTLEEAAATVGLDVGDLDPGFGVIATDPDDGLYTIRVRRDAAEKAREALDARGVGGAEGIFSDPRIAPFGPPED
ncbi:MAG TPA: hypothetical protein VES64_08600 [Allosphingosinicella sp.]|nr:hypothetical protein [Allosphingosinicella sp.]